MIEIDYEQIARISLGRKVSDGERKEFSDEDLKIRANQYRTAKRALDRCNSPFYFVSGVGIRAIC